MTTNKKAVGKRKMEFYYGKNNYIINKIWFPKQNFIYGTSINGTVSQMVSWLMIQFLNKLIMYLQKWYQ